MKDTLTRASRILPDHSPCARSRLSLFTFPISQPIVLRKRESGLHRCAGLVPRKPTKPWSSRILLALTRQSQSSSCSPVRVRTSLSELLNHLVGQGSAKSDQFPMHLSNSMTARFPARSRVGQVRINRHLSSARLPVREMSHSSTNARRWHGRCQPARSPVDVRRRLARTEPGAPLASPGSVRRPWDSIAMAFWGAQWRGGLLLPSQPGFCYSRPDGATASPPEPHQDFSSLVESICCLCGLWKRFLSCSSIVSDPGLGSPVQFLDGVRATRLTFRWDDQGARPRRMSRWQIHDDGAKRAPTSK
jgi:hypothetical protein